MKELSYVGRETSCEYLLPDPNRTEVVWPGATGPDGRAQILQLPDCGKDSSVLGGLFL